MIKNILFDMGGVLFTQSTARAKERFAALGIDTAYYLGDYGQKDFFLDIERGDITPQQFCERMSAVTGREVGMEQARHCWLGFVEGPVPQEWLDALEQLGKRYRLGLLSNTNPFVMSHTNSAAFSQAGLPISHYVPELWLSYELRVCKPSPEIYRQVLAQGGMAADETIFVDDSAKNIQAAGQLGIHGLHVPTNADWRPALEAMLAKLC